MKKMKRSVWVVIVAFFLLLIAGSGMAQEKVIKWKLQDQYAGSGPQAGFLTVPLIEWIHKATNGRLQITRYEPGALASVRDTFDALKRGAFDAAFMYPGFYGGTMPEANIDQGVPYGWTDARAQSLSLFQFGFYDLMRKVYAKHNLHYLVSFPMGDIYGIGTIKPVTKLEDLKGLKLRAVGIYADFVKGLGAAPTSIPYDEMYMALKLGTIDGYLASSSALISGKLGEVIHYYLEPTTNSINCIWAVNMDSWNALPKDIRELLDNAAPMVAVKNGALYSGYVQNAKAEAIKKYKVQFHTLSDADQAKALKVAIPLWDAAGAKSPDCKKAVDIIKETNRYLGKME
jgi:TRAP-type C4-dicarboxylate transport system substrate-binding protein